MDSEKSSLARFIALLATLPFPVAAMYAVMVIVFVPDMADEEAYCENPDHSTPCSLIVEMSDTGLVLLMVGATLLLCAGIALLAFGWWLINRGRTWIGALLTLVALAGPVAAYFLIGLYSSMDA
jgi:hypothetical protein